ASPRGGGGGDGVTQLHDNLLLAPALQERVHNHEAVDSLEPMAERTLRDVVRHESWAEQRKVWTSVVGPAA
ncbi:MAG: hypothetical protein V2A73_03985, partial [Pseudomonadota bacterium]